MGFASVCLLVLAALLWALFTTAAVSSYMTPDRPQHQSLDPSYPQFGSAVLAGANFVTLQAQSSSGNHYTTTSEASNEVTFYLNDSSRASAIAALSSRGFDVIRTDILCSDIRKIPLLSRAYEKVVNGGTVIGCVGGPRPMLIDLVEGVPKMIPLKFTGGKAGSSYSPRVVGAADIDIRVPDMLAARNAAEIVSVTITAHGNGGGGGDGGGGGGNQWRQHQVIWMDNATTEMVCEWLFYIHKMVPRW